MLKGFLSAFSLDLSKRTKGGIEVTINIEEPESKEELDEYNEFVETYTSPTKSSEMPLLEVSIIKKEGKE